LISKKTATEGAPSPALKKAEQEKRGRRAGAAQKSLGGKGKKREKRENTSQVQAREKKKQRTDRPRARALTTGAVAQLHIRFVKRKGGMTTYVSSDEKTGSSGFQDLRKKGSEFDVSKKGENSSTVDERKSNYGGKKPNERRGKKKILLFEKRGA